MRTDSRIDFHGNVIEGEVVRVGFIGCGSHAFRNVYPTLAFTPLQLVATCDLDERRAAAFARQFGAQASYSDHRRMLEQEQLDAVMVVTSLDERGRPRYPDLAIDCLAAGCHVWIEKPPAASCADIERVGAAADAAGRQAMVGLKKMFAPANQKARELSRSPEFGTISLVRAEYPQRIPTLDELTAYRDGDNVVQVASFLDHLCHPASLLQLLLGSPETLLYRRATNGAGIALLTYESGALAELAFTWGGAYIDGLECTVITSDSRQHVVVENNTRVSYHRLPVPGYGNIPDFFTAAPDQATAVWQPEFSLGQLYNKGTFLLGYFGELQEFATCVLEGRAPRHGTLDDAMSVTRLFEAFAEGPDTTVKLS